MKNYLKLIRIKHYIKNLLIFSPIIFSGQLIIPHLLLKAFVGFISFSLVASVVYIINDINDLEYDKKHPYKKSRPLASGAISIKKAICICVIFCITTIIINALGNSGGHISWTYLFIYLIINISYSLGLKNIPVLDISIVVAGYVLRVLFGGALIDVTVSIWMFLTVTAIAFFFAFGKRRNEIKRNGHSARIVLLYYSELFLGKLMYLSLGVAIVFYSLWCVTPNLVITDNEKLLWTIPIVIIICIRYSMNIERDSDGDPAEVLTGDIVLMLMVLFYCIVLATIIYGSYIL